MDAEAQKSNVDDAIEIFKYRFIGLIFGVAALVGCAAMICAFFLVVWQAWRWLQIGEWESISTLIVAEQLIPAWAETPGSWIGVHKIVDRFPLSVSMLFVGSILMSAGMAFYETSQDYIDDIRAKHNPKKRYGWEKTE